jgi:hypothetical protein
MNQTEYFNKIGYKHVYDLGDRVIGKWRKVPFVGTVGNDRVIDDTGPHVLIHLDLPIRLDNITHNLIIVKHRDVKRLKELSV